MKRRTFIQNTTLSTLLLGANTPLFAKSKPSKNSLKLNHNIQHSVCRWCFQEIPLESFLKTLNTLDIRAIDLIGPKDWPLLKKYNIHCAMCNGAEISLTEGWNNPKYHRQLIENYTEMIPKVAKAGYTNLICFSGNRVGMDNQTGLKHCVDGLSKIIPLAEKHDVIIHMELFNQIDHPDYMADTSKWGIELCKSIASDNFKLLFDIYHMQIQEGDIIRSIRDHHQYFGHYHTAGVPGRHEIDNSQELYYPAIMREIVKTGYQGYVAQEFIVTKTDKINALKEAFSICDV